MMSARVKNILVVFLLVLLAFESITSEAVEDKYYIEKNYLQIYQNDNIICGNIMVAVCAPGSIGCRIQFSTDANRKFLQEKFSCINKDKTVGLTAGKKTELPRARTINIELDIYRDTESAYSVGYGLGGDEFANGVIALEKWHEMKETFRREKQRVDDANA